MLGSLPGIPETWFHGHRLTSGIEGLVSNLGVGCPMRGQAKDTGLCFPLGHRFITGIGFFGAANERRNVTGPDIELALICWRRNTEVAQVTFPFLDRLIVAAHYAHLALYRFTDGIKPATGDMVKGA